MERRKERKREGMKEGMEGGRKEERREKTNLTPPQVVICGDIISIRQ